MSGMKRSTTAANASLISTRSMSSTVRPALASALRAAGAGPVSMMVGSAPETAAATMRARGVSPSAAPASSVPIDDQRGAVDDAGGVAGVCARGRSARPSGTSAAPPRRSRPCSPIVGERRLERGQRLDGGAGPDVLVAVEDDQAVAVADRHDGAVEVAVGPGLGGALLRLGGVRVDVVAGEALEGGDQVGADALRHEAGARSWSPGPSPRRRRRSPSAPATSTRRRRRAPGPPSRSGPSARRG